MRKGIAALFKMVCLDVDGTVLNSRHEVPDAVQEAVAAVVCRRSIPVILVSGRMPRAVRAIEEELELPPQPVVCYGGALVEDERGEPLLRTALGTVTARRVIRLARGHHCRPYLYRDDEWFVEELDEWSDREAWITRARPVRADFASLLGEWGKRGRGPNKVLCLGYPEAVGELQRTLEERAGNVRAFASNPTHLEVVSAETSKTAAIEVLRKRYGVRRAEVLAIGDSMNDIDMLRYAGLGVAMGNAPDAVRQHADEIAPSNDEDGVAAVLRKYLLAEE